MFSNFYPMIERFYGEKFIYRFKYNDNQKKFIPKKEEIQMQNMYLRNTIFSNENENIVKRMIILKYKYKDEIITLNINYEDYSDLWNKIIYNIN
jgi:type II secretory pathway component PulL